MLGSSPDLDVYVLVDSEGTLSGTFSNYPVTGSIVSVDGVDYEIIYNTGADGNDIYLVKAQPAVIYVDDSWTGTAAGTLLADGDLETATVEIKTDGDGLILTGFPTPQDLTWFDTLGRKLHEIGA